MKQGCWNKMTGLFLLPAAINQNERVSTCLDHGMYIIGKQQETTSRMPMYTKASKNSSAMKSAIPGMESSRD